MACKCKYCDTSIEEGDWCDTCEKAIEYLERQGVCGPLTYDRAMAGVYRFKQDVEVKSGHVIPLAVACVARVRELELVSRCAAEMKRLVN